MLKGLTRSPWAGYLTQKLLELTAGILLLIVVTFLLVLLVPGDAAVVIAGIDASPQDIENVRTQLGLDRPALEQFWQYTAGVVTGDLDQSFRTGQPVTEVIGVRLPYTVSIALGAIVISFCAAIIIGMSVAGLTRNGSRRWLDVGFSWGSSVLQTFPQFVYGAILVAVFAVWLGVLPAAGARSYGSYILPTLALALGPTFSIARIVRRETTTVLETDYMRTARGWRIGLGKQYIRYAFPNILASTLTLSGIIMASMLGGAIIVESVFTWPGLGNGVVEAIIDRDYPVIRGIILTVGLLAISINFLVDIVLAIVDPRVLTAGKAFS